MVYSGEMDACPVCRCCWFGGDKSGQGLGVEDVSIVYVVCVVVVWDSANNQRQGNGI